MVLEGRDIDNPMLQLGARSTYYFLSPHRGSPQTLTAPMGRYETPISLVPGLEALGYENIVPPGLLAK